MEKWIRTQQHSTNPIAMIPTIVSGIKTPFCGNGTKIRNNLSSRISLSAHNSNTDPEATDPIDLELEKQKAKMVILSLGKLIKYWNNGPWTLKGRAEFFKGIIDYAFAHDYNAIFDPYYGGIADFQNTDLIGSIAMARALCYCLLKFPLALSLNPNLPTTRPSKKEAEKERVRILFFEQTGIDAYYINTILDGYTNEQIEEDCNTIITISNDIKNNADKYAQVIVTCSNSQSIYPRQSIYTTDPELIAFSSEETDSTLDSRMYHDITSKALTDYLKWCANRLITNANSVLNKLGESNKMDPSALESLEELTICAQAAFLFHNEFRRRDIRKYAKIIKFWKNWKVPKEAKAKFVEKLIFISCGSSNYDLSNREKLERMEILIKCTINKYDPNYDQNIRAICSEEKLEQERILVIEEIDYVKQHSYELAEMILLQYKDTVTINPRSNLWGNYSRHFGSDRVTDVRLASVFVLFVEQIYSKLS